MCKVGLALVRNPNPHAVLDAVGKENGDTTVGFVNEYVDLFD